MRTWTVDEMLAEGPCDSGLGGRYSRENLTILWGGRESVSLLDIAESGLIPDEDVIWCATRPGALTEAEMQAWLIDRVVARAMTNHALNCEIPVVKAWAGKWLSGEDRSAWAARAAAGAAEAADAAMAAAEAAEAAAWAARAAAGAAWAARAAAGAAWAAARAAEHRLQVRDLIEVLRQEAG